jgi:hypothetical protein
MKFIAFYDLNCITDENIDSIEERQTSWTTLRTPEDLKDL